MHSRHRAAAAALPTLLLAVLAPAAVVCAATPRAPRPPGALPLPRRAVQETPRSLHPEARDAIAHLRSPFCPGLMLEVCPSPAAAVVRDSIEALAEAGWTSEGIVTWFTAEFGEEWRAEPRWSGAGLAAWVLPPLALLAGLGVVAVVLAKRRNRFVGLREATPPAPEVEEKLRAAIREVEEEEEPVF